MAESNADVYASFGVNSAVMSGGSVEEHEQNMLALDVAARDGDDAIELASDEAETERDLYHTIYLACETIIMLRKLSN